MNDETARLRIQRPKKGGGGEDFSRPGPRVAQRKHIWRAPGLRILKLDQTESGQVSHFANEDAYYFPDS